MTKPTIVKVQRPVVTNDPNALLLIYDEDRQTYDIGGDLACEVLRWMGVNYKKFAYMTNRGSEQIDIDLTQDAPWQDW